MEGEDKSHEYIDSKNVESSKEGKSPPLSSNKAHERFPFLNYTCIPNPEKLNKAFDILFEEVLKNNPNALWNQEN